MKASTRRVCSSGSTCRWPSHSPASRFITLFYGLYDPRDGSLEFVNAGHLPPIIRRADGRFERVDSPGAGGVALGMFDKSTYSTQVAHIERGDVFVLYSDGITEAENRSGRPFDESGLETIITAKPRATRKPSAAPCWPRSKPMPAMPGWPTI